MEAERARSAVIVVLHGAEVAAEHHAVLSLRPRQIVAIDKGVAYVVALPGVADRGLPDSIYRAAKADGRKVVCARIRKSELLIPVRACIRRNRAIPEFVVSGVKDIHHVWRYGVRIVDAPLIAIGKLKTRVGQRAASGAALLPHAAA